MGAFAPPPLIAVHFGEWRTAGQLAAAHDSAAVHALTVYSSIRLNLAEFSKRLLATSENYRRAEANIVAALARRVRPDDNVWVRAADLPTLPPAAGLFEIARQRPYPESADAYDSHVIADWLRQLQSFGAARAHYDMSRAWRAVGEAAQRLGDVLFQQAVDIYGSWQDAASPLAQHKLRRIEGTAQALSGSAWTLSPLARYTAEAIEETLSDARPGGSLMWSSSTRQARLTAAFDQLNSRYREIIDAYPWSIPFDLPFGTVPPPRIAPAADAPRNSPPVPGAGAGPAPFAAPAVIGGEIPRSWAYDYADNGWLGDTDSGGSNLVG
ncbi:MAG TPA: hypothetical protein VFU43_00520 [Streptosporangiaceae bacterium]|nr:hypothetical protein [Streptosporangiaceae bacterium]